MTRRLVQVGAFVCGTLILLATNATAQGHFEFGGHYGAWSVNLLRPYANDLADHVANELVDKEVEKIQQTYPSLSKVSSTNQIDFDSSGNNVGVEFRWYPGGEKGGFSLGVAGEKTTLRIGYPNAATRVSLRQTSSGVPFTFDASGSVHVEATPFALVGTLRWDILPTRRFTPYVTFGVGAAGVGALDRVTYDYQFSGTLSSAVTAPVQVAESQHKTLKQLKAEEDFDYPVQFFPFVQLNVGFKAKLTRQLHLLIDAGVLDGAALRIGIAVRL
jgi:hypothetical protein